MNTSSLTHRPAAISLLACLCFAGTVIRSSNVCANDAVSAVNGKIEASYGEVNDTYSRGIAASLSIPVAESLGLQFDSLYQHAAEDDFYGIGGHFFTRMSEVGLLGLFVGGIKSGSSMDNLAVAVEGELYFDKVTVGTFLGYDHVDKNGLVSTFTPRVNNHDDFPLANVYAAIYPIDDLMVRVDYTNRFNRNFYDLTVEYQTPISGLAAFGIVGVGDGDFVQVQGGMRYYFGAKKTLKLRHRQDDPLNPLSGIFQSTGQAAGQNGTPPTPAAPPPRNL